MDDLVPGRCNSGDSAAVVHMHPTGNALRARPLHMGRYEDCGPHQARGSAMHNPQHYYYSLLNFKLLSRGASEQ